MIRLSSKACLMLVIGMSGCAAPGLSEPLAGLPYASPGMTGPSMPRVDMANFCPMPAWTEGTGSNIRPVAYKGDTSATMQAGSPSDPILAGDVCACTRSQTRPVRRFLHTLFYPNCTRLTPVANTAVASQPAGMPGYHMVSGVPVPLPANRSSAPTENAASTAQDPGVRAMPEAGPTVAMAGPPMPETPAATPEKAPVPAVPQRIETPGTHAVQPMPSAARPAETSPDAPPGPPVHLVNEKSIRLNCKLRDVGPSGLSAVEVWFTQDGKHWQKAEHNCPPQPPYVMDVKDDGRYGITLIARNGLGMSKPGPVLGEAPQVWVEVDTTRPVVQLGKPRFASTESVRELTIGWSASDRNLGPRSIKLAYAEKAQGPWVAIADVENTGTFAWRLPAKLPATFFVRVQATDTAGNSTAVVSTEPVVIDMSQPTVEILSVESYRKR